MNYKRLFRTVCYLRPIQVVYQLKNRLYKAKYVQLSAPAHKMLKLDVEPIARYKSLEGDEFTFLNLRHKFTDWNFTGHGMLFTYNQNYFDFINEDGIDREVACQWIDRFIADRPSITWGMDPYPIALRSINWMKFFSKHPQCATKEREDSLWSQLCLLEKKLEYHLLGNHLIEDFYALYIGGCYFQDEGLRHRSYRLLIEQLQEQTLPDGGHYEQSPMYHCILLDRLLDCINFGTTEDLKAMAQKQLGWLEAICYDDGTWPFFNDSALDIAPTTGNIFDYAKRLGLSWSKTTLGESGYRKLKNGTIELVADVGNITATYQPGHTHADCLNYELRVDGKPVVVDTGISTYDKTPRRQYERSSVAHNMVVKEGATTDSSDCCYEIWGGFRVGKRCQTKILKETTCELVAEHKGYGTACRRKWILNKGCLTVEDYFGGEAISFIHLAAGIDPKQVKIEGANRINILDTQYSTNYNRLIGGKTIVIQFTNQTKYSIS